MREKGEKGGWSFVEPMETNRGNKPYCFIINSSTDSLLISSSCNTGTVWNRAKRVAKEVTTRQILLKTSRTSSGAGTESFYSVQEATGRLKHATKRNREDRNKVVTECFLP